MPYQHITREERVKIEAWKRSGESNGNIAKFLGRHCSTIGRELNRNKQKYRAVPAEHRRIEVRKTANASRKKIIAGSDLAKYIEERLRKYWSPEQIVGRMKRECPDEPGICHETIYKYIRKEKPELEKYLRCRKGRYRRRYGTKIREKRREEAKKKRIDMRPDIAKERLRIGDWEGDTIVGKEKTKHILTHVDRKSGLLLADKVEQATAEQVRKITTRRFKRIAKKNYHTITYDNGIQFNEHQALERDLNIDIYFAHPYHSWERGTNENTNGLLRQFIPKGSYFERISKRKLDRYVKLINTRPRKRHDYLTPQEIFDGVAV